MERTETRKGFSYEEVRKGVIQCFATASGCPVSSLKAETNIYSELDWDSLDSLSLKMELEQFFFIETSYQQYLMSQTIGEFVDYIWDLLGKKSKSKQ